MNKTGIQWTDYTSNPIQYEAADGSVSHNDRRALTARDRRILAGLEQEPEDAFECERCMTTYRTSQALATHLRFDHPAPRDPEPAEPVRWLAWRVRNGKPISAAIAAEHFGTTARQAGLWMAGGWARFVGEGGEA